MRCAVIGAGAWGTALAQLLARQGHAVTLWAHEPEVADEINSRHENSRFLAGARLDAGLVATSELTDAGRGAELVLLVPPAQHLRRVVRRLAPALSRDCVAVVASKGIELDSLALMSGVVREELPALRAVALSGPSFAAEVAAGQPTAVVAASEDGPAAELVQDAFSSTSFRVYTQTDVIGVELGGALKNVIAVATGIAEGLGLGFNARAALITRGLAEITRLGLALGAEPSTFAGLAGMGDLVLTCTGALSRNRALGADVGRGVALEQALASRQTVAEGVPTTRSAHALAAREGVDMPIVAAVHRMLFENQAPRSAISELMSRALRSESDW